MLKKDYNYIDKLSDELPTFECKKDPVDEKKVTKAAAEVQPLRKRQRRLADTPEKPHVVKGIIRSTGTVALFVFPSTNFVVYCYSILWTLFIGNSQ